MSLKGVSFNDAEWRCALRWRLGIENEGPPRTCINVSVKSGEVCGEELDAEGVHALTCPRGPALKARHDEQCDLYADFTEETGARARREVYVPELSGDQEAWLDVLAYGTPDVQDLLLDITVRHPGAARYQPNASTVAGYTAAKAEAEKLAAYPPAGGRSVTPIAAETWGRWGAIAEATLMVLAAAAARHDRRRAREPGGRLARWRAQLDGALQRSVAASLFAAQFGPPGRANQRQVNKLPLAELEHHAVEWRSAA